MLDRTIAIENYWANVVGDTAEFKEIAVAENPELNNLLGCICRILKDAFINEATEYGVGRWETILGLQPNPLSTLDDRKIAILTFLSTTRPYTMRTLKNMLTTALGDGNFTMHIENDTQTLNISASTNTKLDDVYYLIQRVIPQNLNLELIEHETVTLNANDKPNDFVTYRWAQINNINADVGHLQTITIHLSPNINPSNKNPFYLGVYQLLNDTWTPVACSINAHTLLDGEEIVFNFPKGTVLQNATTRLYPSLDGTTKWEHNVNIVTRCSVSTDGSYVYQEGAGFVNYAPYVTINLTRPVEI